MKKGFTLIELLAVIIILAIVALIATPIVLNVVDSAKDSAMKSQLSLYADSIKLQLTSSYLTNAGKYSEVIDLNDDNLDKSITCEEAHYTKDNKVLLGNCTIKSYNGNYWYVNGEVSDGKPANFDSLKANVIASNGEIILQEYVDNSGANKPELFNNMIPVIYENNNWIYADKTEKWYDYDEKEWANAIVLNSGVTKSVGQTISESEIAMMFVWIPRYKYTIFNGNNESVPEQEINIIFESGIDKTGTVNCTTQTRGYGNSSETCNTRTNGVSTYTHPAFCFGHRTNGVCDGSELMGIWVGKFENSTTDVSCNTNQDNDSCNKVLPVTIKPNVQSWRRAIVSTFYTSIMNIKTGYNINADSHMMKNMEWGAVAYLSHSKYGRCDNGTCTEIAKNDSSDFYTGRSLGKPSTAYYEYSSAGTYQYHVNQGQLASTTGNIYGVYDMSGGAEEYVMGNKVDSSNNFLSRHAGFEIPPPIKYYDSYSEDESLLTYSRGKLGDATKETLQKNDGSNVYGWYFDGKNIPVGTNSWFVRSGYFDSSMFAGIFYFNAVSGGSGNIIASRSVIVA